MSEDVREVVLKNHAGPLFVGGVAIVWTVLFVVSEIKAPRQSFVPMHPHLTWVGSLVILAGLIGVLWPGLHDIVLKRAGICARLALVGIVTDQLEWREIDEVRIIESSVIPFVPLAVRGLPHRHVLQVYVDGRLRMGIGLWRESYMVAEFLRTTDSGLTPADWTYSALGSRRERVWRRAGGLV